MIRKNLLLIFCALALQWQYGNAQGFSASNVWVSSGSELYVGYTTNIVLGSKVETDKTTTTPGVISFKSLPANTDASGLIDGYVKVYGNSGTLYFPVGDEGVWHAAAGDDTTDFLFAVEVLDATSTSAALTSEFTGGEPANSNSVNGYVATVKPYGSWTMAGNNTGKLRIRWSGATLETESESVDALNLNIGAWDSTASEWVFIPAQLSSGADWGSGTLTSTDAVNFSEYSKFAIVTKQKECLAIVDATATTTWNGTTWSNGIPDEKKDAIITGALNVTSTTSFTANSLALNANVSIADGSYIEVVKGVTGTSTIAIASEGSFVQRAGSVTAPGITLTKETRPLKKYDYVYWGTPISGDFKSQLANTHAVGYTAEAFEVYYKYVSEAGTTGSWQNLDVITTGKGFNSRIAAQAPYTDNTTTTPVMFPMVGTANNGDVTVTLGSVTSGSRSYNLLANPYPSAIDAGIFLTENANLGGVIYLWTANEFNSGGQGNTSSADYATWTLAGGVAASPIAQMPTGKIASAQGFMVKGITAGGDVTFTNCMRVKEGNDNFFRTAAPEAHDRYWLNLTNNVGAFNQILVNYTEECTYDFDRLYDAPRNSVSTSRLYTLIDEGKYAINSRPEFVLEDVVPVGVSRGEADITDYTIAIDRTEGLFSDGDVDIYLHDLLNDSYHNLNEGPYNFSIDGTQVNDRFEVVYRTQALDTDNPVADNTNLFMYIKDNTFSLKASKEVKSVQIFDLTGRLIENLDVKNTEFAAPFNHAQSIYIAKATLQNGAVTSQKLAN